MNRFSILCLILLLQEKRNYLSPPQSYVKVKLVCCLLTPNRIWFWRIADDWNAIQLLLLATTQYGIYGFDSALYSWCTSNTCIRTLHIEFIRIACIWSDFFELFDEKRCEKNYKNGNISSMRSLNCTILSNERKKKHFHQIWKKNPEYFQVKK